MLVPDSSSFETLINYFSFAAWVFYGVTVSALIWLRYRKPEMKRPYKVSYAALIINYAKEPRSFIVGPLCSGGGMGQG